MKKVLLILVLFGLLSAVTPAYAGDIDGAWAISSNNQVMGYAMIRADAGNILVVICDYWQALMADWMPLAGPFDGTTGNLSLIFTSQENGNLPSSLTATFTLTSATTGTITIGSCTNFPGQDNCGPSGSVVDLSKIF